MLFKSLKSLLFSTLRLTLFVILFIDTTNIRLQTTDSRSDISNNIFKRELDYTEMFHMPSAEEQKARVAEWEEKLVGKYLDDDLTDKKQNDLDQASVQPSDATEKEKDNNGDNEAQDIDEQKGMPQQQPELVKLSTLPQPVRVIKPGSRVTRDLRPNRMNVVCDEKGLILKIGFY